MIDFAAEFNSSYKRVLGGSTSQGNEFFDAFYQRFIASSPMIAEKFRDTDMDKQKTMLKQSLPYLLNLYSTKTIPDALSDIARVHDRQHADIPRELYQAWMDCLVETVREFDSKFSDDVELAWRMVCSQGIAFMIYQHEKS